MQRGEVFELPAPRQIRGHEQRGRRYGVVLQNDRLLSLSTVIVAPTSTHARPALFRPEIELEDLEDGPTRVIVEQMAAIDPSRLGRSAGFLTFGELRAVDHALADVLGLG